MSTLFVISVIFMLSLVGAVVLFKFFRSSAIVKTKSYQAGGAIAGFIIIYATLYGSYYQIEKNEHQNLLDEHKEMQKKLEPKAISGTIQPYEENTKVVLAVREIDPDKRGKFRLIAPCIDPEVDDVRLFIISERGNFDWAIYSRQEMTGIKIPIPH